MYNKHELFIGRLPSDPDPDKLQQLFHTKGIRFVNLSLKEKNGKGFGFLLCLTNQDLEKAVYFDGISF